MKLTISSKDSIYVITIKQKTLVETNFYLMFPLKKPFPLKNTIVIHMHVTTYCDSY